MVVVVVVFCVLCSWSLSVRCWWFVVVGAVRSVASWLVVVSGVLGYSVLLFVRVDT